MADQTIPDNGSPQMGRWTTWQVVLGILCGFLAGVYLTLAVVQHDYWLLPISACFLIGASGFVRDARRLVTY